MLTAHLPWDGPTARALLRAKTSEEPRPPVYHVPGFDPHLEAIILRAIERDPRQRQPSAAALLAELRDPAAVAPRDPSLSSRNRAARRSRRLALAAALAAVTVGLGSLVWLSHRYAGPPVPTPAARTR
jgi:serine/threonine-protein kinase